MLEQAQLRTGSGKLGPLTLSSPLTLMDGARGAVRRSPRPPRADAARWPARPHAGAAGGAACGDLVRIAVRSRATASPRPASTPSGCGARRGGRQRRGGARRGRPFLDGGARRRRRRSPSALGGLRPAKSTPPTLAADALAPRARRGARDGARRLPASGAPHARGDERRRRQRRRRPAGARAGDDVVAVTLELWADPATDGERSCCSPQAVRGARALAHGMGIPHVTLDLRERVPRRGRRRLRRRLRGRPHAEPVRALQRRWCASTRCSTLADRLGAARLATGHYARIARDDRRGRCLRAARDPRKDQSYMLARLDPAAARAALRSRWAG